MMEAVGQPRLVALELRLRRPVGIHLEEGMSRGLAAIIVVAPRKNHASVIEQARKSRIRLIESDTAGILAVFVHDKQIAQVSPPAGNVLDDAG